MNRRPQPQHQQQRIVARAFLRRAALLPLCLAVAACDPVDAPNAAHARKYRAPLPEPRRTDHPEPENARWLAAWRDLRARLAPLEQQLAGAQRLHAEHEFDHFLEIDPATLETAELCSLFHFLERGYFTVEREVLVHLLERRLQRDPSMIGLPAGAASASFKDRLAAAMQRDELRMVDLETAIDHYGNYGAQVFSIPQNLSDEEIDELRAAVSTMMEKKRAEVAALDEKIAALKSRAFGLPAGELAAPAADAATVDAPVDGPVDEPVVPDGAADVPPAPAPAPDSDSDFAPDSASIP